MKKIKSRKSGSYKASGFSAHELLCSRQTMHLTEVISVYNNQARRGIYPHTSLSLQEECPLLSNRNFPCRRTNSLFIAQRDGCRKFRCRRAVWKAGVDVHAGKTVTWSRRWHGAVWGMGRVGTTGLVLLTSAPPVAHTYKVRQIFSFLLSPHCFRLVVLKMPLATTQ